MSISLRSKVSLYTKNTFGWYSNRKIVVFSVDDYGNIRMASKQARENLRKAGLAVDKNRFDQYDSLETASDLSALFDVLTSVKDKNGRSAVFTAYALPANIDFERMTTENYEAYRYELLPTIFSKLPGYEGTWDMWLQGMNEHLLVPQFHGREHVNVKLLMELLQEGDQAVRACFYENSLGALTVNRYPTIAYVASFDFDKVDENKQLQEIASDGLRVFEKVFGTKAKNFNSPGVPAHHTLEKILSQGGIRYVDAAFIKREHQGSGKHRYHFNYWGKQNGEGQYYLLRNSVFEPSLSKYIDWVDQCMAEIDIAFRFGKPANISSHRVNFCGHIEPLVRDHGLMELRKLLITIVKRWPDVEFMSANELGDLIALKRD